MCVCACVWWLMTTYTSVHNLLNQLLFYHQRALLLLLLDTKDTVRIIHVPMVNYKYYIVKYSNTLCLKTWDEGAGALVWSGAGAQLGQHCPWCLLGPSQPLLGPSVSQHQCCITQHRSVLRTWVLGSEAKSESLTAVTRGICQQDTLSFSCLRFRFIVIGWQHARTNKQPMALLWRCGMWEELLLCLSQEQSKGKQNRDWELKLCVLCCTLNWPFSPYYKKEISDPYTHGGSV